MSESVEFQKVKIDPIGCYTGAFGLVKGRYWLLLGVSAVGMLIGGAVPIPLIGPMMCGIYLCFLEKYRGNDFDFALLFKGFDYFVPSLIASLIMTGLSMVIITPGFLVLFFGMFGAIASMEQGGGQEVPAVWLVVLAVLCFLLVALLVAVGLLLMFTFQLIVDRKLSGTAAIIVSARAVMKNFAGLLGLMLINIVLSLVGVLACYVGTFFIIPISLAAITIAYRKVFPEIAGDTVSVPAETAPATP